MVRTRRNASDTGNPDPGLPVAGLPAVDEGIMENDLACNVDDEMDDEMEEIIIQVPLENNTAHCILCRNKNKSLSFLSLKDLLGHYDKHHNNTKTALKCLACAKVFPGIKNWNGHRPKCKGFQQESDKAFKCTECALTFDTQMGRSQHERHAHPNLRNAKRREEAERPHGVPGRRDYVWTSEETELLMKLNDRFKNSRFPNKEIQRYIPHKTLKQISDKRRCLSVEPSEEDRSSQENQPELVVAVEVNNTAVDVSDRENRDMETQEAWKVAMQAFIESIRVPAESKLVNLENSLREIWRENTGNLDRFSELIDAFIAEQLVPVLTSTNVKSKTKTNKKTDSNKKDDKYNSNKKGINKSKNKRNNNNGKDNNGNKNQDINTRNKSKNHTQRKRFGYARCQDLFNKCPKKLAELAIKNDVSFIYGRQELPSAENIHNFYTNLWGQTGQTNVDLPIVVDQTPQLGINEVIRPITLQEVKERIVKTKSRTAAGLDGIRKRQLMRSGLVELLTILYNILLVEGHFPTLWRQNRTTLIPKSDNNCDDVKNWRPITIGSLLSRVFTALLDGKLRKFVTQSNRQKGFASEDGCKFNTLLLKEAINEMKTKSGGVVTVLDITKAFDTVPHSMISLGLKTKGVPEHIIDLVKRMYDDCRTTIKAAENKSVEVLLRRGVKQGDPLSPLLFNLAIEPIIKYIDECTEGVSVNNEFISVLAFADDIVLIAKNEEEARKQVEIVNKYFTSINMSLSVSKCATFQIMHKNKSWYIKDPTIAINNDPITYIQPEEALTYLGTKIRPWSSLIKGSEVPSIIKIIKNVKKLYLKPHQKLELIQTYILPHFIYSLTINVPPKGTLKLLDSEIRQQLKEILHLPLSTATGFFYTPKKDGGLGFIKFQNLVPLAVIRNGIRMQQSTDPAIRAIVNNERMQNTIEKYCNDTRLTKPETLEEVERAKMLLRNREVTSWEELQLQGQGVKDYRGDKIGNKWLMDPTLLKGSRFIDAIRLRTNTFGTRVVLSKFKPNAEITCRRCSIQAETLGHILGICIHTKPARIKRHNDIRDFLANKLSKNNTVLVEPTVDENGELKKPDLVIKNGTELQIIDVTIRYENKDYLKLAAEEKLNKYKSTAELLKTKLGCTQSVVLPVVIGSRGTMPKETKMCLKKLGFAQKDMLTLSMMTFRSSIEIANAFIDYD